MTITMHLLDRMHAQKITKSTHTCTHIDTGVVSKICNDWHIKYMKVY